MRLLIARFLRLTQETLIAFGHIWVYIPPVSDAALRGPAPGHPEGLRPDIPLSAVERALQRQFLDTTTEEGMGPRL